MQGHKLFQPVRARRSTVPVLQPAESAKAAFARQLPTVDITLHFERFFTLRQEKKEDARNGGKRIKTRQFFLGAAAWLALIFA